LRGERPAAPTLRACGDVADITQDNQAALMELRVSATSSPAPGRLLKFNRGNTSSNLPPDLEPGIASPKAAE